MKLYELPGIYATIDQQLDESGGEITPEIQQQLDEADAALEDKVDRIAALIRNATAEEEACKAEAAHFRDRAQAAANKADSLKAYLQHNLEAIGRDRVQGQRFKVGVYQNSVPSIRWTRMPEDAPLQFQRVKVEVDGQAAQRWLKEGKELPSGFLVERGSHVRIK
jgi:hypothetical protein